MSNMYLDPNGRTITYKQWKKRIPAEYILHEHKTPKTSTRLLAADIVMDANLIPAERHKRYKMESTNILTHDAMGEPYPEPKFVEDEFARKTFSTKDKAIDGYASFLVEWCGGDDADLRSTLAREVPVTEVPAIDIRAKDMELRSLSARVPATAAPVSSDEIEDMLDDIERGGGDPEGDADEAEERKAKAKKAADAPKAAAGTDRPKTVIADDIGSW